ncbi:MAG: RICIN domain-containing protein, partial [Clostridia bacterium]|nr:RICIN domain-containing protein [Clostridia bacterium]
KVTEVANGTYFLKNKQSGKYADIYHQEMEDGTNVHQWEFHGGNTQRSTFCNCPIPLCVLFAFAAHVNRIIHIILK